MVSTHLPVSVAHLQTGINVGWQLDLTVMLYLKLPQAMDYGTKRIRSFKVAYYRGIIRYLQREPLAGLVLSKGGGNHDGYHGNYLVVW